MFKEVIMKRLSIIFLVLVLLFSCGSGSAESSVSESAEVVVAEVSSNATVVSYEQKGSSVSKNYIELVKFDDGLVYTVVYFNDSEPGNSKLIRMELLTEKDDMFENIISSKHLKKSSNGDLTTRSFSKYQLGEPNDFLSKILESGNYDQKMIFDVMYQDILDYILINSYKSNSDKMDEAIADMKQYKDTLVKVSSDMAARYDLSDAGFDSYVNGL